MAKRNHQTKKKWLAKEVAKAVNAGKTSTATPVRQQSGGTLLNF